MLFYISSITNLKFLADIFSQSVHAKELDSQIGLQETLTCAPVGSGLEF